MTRGLLEKTRSARPKVVPMLDSDYRRTDAFDFRSVKIQGDTAYAVYFLKSEITDKKNGTRNREWLESAILRRSGSAGGWHCYTRPGS